jgi:YebC/PmpR family DNA-binding regulatory protein
MPNDNVQRAIDKGTGAGADAQAIERITYEGYAPGGVAVMVEVLTDNRNRAASDIRYIFSKNGGKLGTSGSVSYLFERKGVILVPKTEVDEDELIELALEAGAEDVEPMESDYRVVTAPEDFVTVRQSLKNAGIAFENAEITMQPLNSVDLDTATAKQTLRLIDALEENDDVQEVYANFDISDEVMSSVASETVKR